VSGLGGIYWCRGHAALSAAEEAGRDYAAMRSPASAARTVWGHAPGRRDIARGEPVRDGWLRFKLSDADYLQLAGENVSAIVTVDQMLRRFWVSSSAAASRDRPCFNNRWALNAGVGESCAYAQRRRERPRGVSSAVGPPFSLSSPA
jgi:hypothetical protein